MLIKPQFLAQFPMDLSTEPLVEIIKHGAERFADAYKEAIKYAKH